MISPPNDNPQYIVRPTLEEYAKTESMINDMLSSRGYGELIAKNKSLEIFSPAWQEIFDQKTRIAYQITHTHLFNKHIFYTILDLPALNKCAATLNNLNRFVVSLDKVQHCTGETTEIFNKAIALIDTIKIELLQENMGSLENDVSSLTTSAPLMKVNEESKPEHEGSETKQKSRKFTFDKFDIQESGKHLSQIQIGISIFQKILIKRE